MVPRLGPRPIDHWNLKRLCLAKRKPELVTDDLDEYKLPLQKGSHVVFRHMEGNWYLYYDITY